MTPGFLLTCSLVLAQPADKAEWLLAPQLQQGLELVYLGSCDEESLIPNVQFVRSFRLEATVLTLEQGKSGWHVALLTNLSQRDLNKNAKPEKGAEKREALLGSSVRLELGVLDPQGKLRGKPNEPLTIPVQGPPTLEGGMLVEFPIVRIGKNAYWEVNEEGRPPRTWQLLGSEACGGVQCLKLAGQQQSEDWDRPRADSTAWRRRDVVWISPQLGVAQKVERTIERRDPARREPTQRIVARYELESRLRYPGKLFEDRAQEILKARRFHDEAQPLLAQPLLYKSQIDGLLKKVEYHLEHQAPTPYRKAVLHLANRLDGARRGETASPPTVDEKPLPGLPAGVKLGQKTPDFVVSQVTGKESTRLQRLLGRPVLVFFYNPHSDAGKEVLRFAQRLSEQHGAGLAVLALAVTADADLARKQHVELGLSFPIHDGKGLHLTFGVEATPRLVILDPEGIVRFTHTGWGAHTPREVAEELSRCMPR